MEQKQLDNITKELDAALRHLDQAGYSIHQMATKKTSKQSFLIMFALSFVRSLLINTIKVLQQLTLNREI